MYICICIHMYISLSTQCPLPVLSLADDAYDDDSLPLLGARCARLGARRS